MTTAERFVRKIECEEDGLYFNRYFFKQRFGSKMEIGEHHEVIQSALNRTMLPTNDPEFISRLIINVPPGYTKTEIASIGYMARGLAINPQSRFLHLSYSDTLVLLNSSTTRQIIKSPEFQGMWSVQIKDDSDSKKVWHTTAGGGVTATSAGGQVTGFRAGHMDASEFSGALIIDDPVKPDDAYSEVKRGGVNDRYNETIASRVAIESVPIIVIMQRIHYNDLCGYLLRGGSGEKWHHLNLPVIIDNQTPYKKEYTHGIPIDHGLPNGWLWPFKHSDKHLLALKSHRRRWKAQYLQDPAKPNEESALWSEELLTKAKELNFSERMDSIRTVVSVDPATTDKETSDEHGITVASKYRYPDLTTNKYVYSVDADYTRRGSPRAWALAAMYAYKKHNADAIIIETNQGGDMCESNLRNNGYKGRIIRVHAKKGKTLRAEPVVSLYEQCQVEHKPGLSDIEDEMENFDPISQKSNGASPNRVDSITQALTELAGIGNDLSAAIAAVRAQYRDSL